MNPETILEDYTLRREKIIGSALVFLIFAIWWEDAWGTSINQLADFKASLKIGLFVATTFIALQILPKGITWPAGACMAIALAYNPFLPLKLNRENWVIVHFVAGLAMLWAVTQIFKISKTMTARQQLAAERAKAIQAALDNGTLNREQYETQIAKHF